MFMFVSVGFISLFIYVQFVKTAILIGVCFMLCAISLLILYNYSSRHEIAVSRI